MRIAYGIFGYGLGHATRASALLQEICRRHEVLVFAGGDAYEALKGQYHVIPIPTLVYAYGANGRVSTCRTIRENLNAAVELLRNGHSLRRVLEKMNRFGAQAVISDAEPWTHRAAARAGIPRIGFDHFGIMVYCRPAMPAADRLSYLRDRLMYRFLMGVPERVIVSSFYRAPPRISGVKIVGTVLRDEIYRAAPSDGHYLLVYFNKGPHQFLTPVERALRGVDMPVVIYGVRDGGVKGNLEFKPLSNMPFVRDMAGCMAVVSTAGNQLVGEAVHFGKPMLVFPEDAVEQRLNASELERLGLGTQTTLQAFSSTVIRSFLNDLPRYKANIQKHRRDGRKEAVAAIEAYLRELVK